MFPFGLPSNSRAIIVCFNFKLVALTSCDFLELNFIEFEIDFNKIFENLKDKKYWIKKYPAYKKQINETYEVKINLTEYIKWITDNIGSELKPIINNGILERRFLTKERAYDYINDAIKINLGNIWFKVSDEGRFYNSTTNLSYTAIPHFTLKRRKVKEIDVVNCQPLLLCGLIKNKIYKKDVEDGIFYEKMANELGLKKGNFTVSLDGSANMPRPLAFSSSGPTVSFSGESIAATLTDITIVKGTETYYISAKFGGTLTFFNSGVAKTLPANEIKSGQIKNPNGIALLKTLGIDNKSFCNVFNYYEKGKAGEFKPKQISADIAQLQNLVSSGIGSGYYYAQAGKGEDQFFKIDSKYNKKASTITSEPQVYYGGIDGKGKRVDVVFESDKYYFKVNIRNKQGGLYPTHIMCDYKAK
jgi:hypothetical protein